LAAFGVPRFSAKGSGPGPLAALPLHPEKAGFPEAAILTRLQHACRSLVLLVEDTSTFSFI
jgi:hypothetical protein